MAITPNPALNHAPSRSLDGAKAPPVSSTLEPMGFGTPMRQAADESQPLALRYTAFRHGLTYSRLGFHTAWAFAESRFGLREGQPASSLALKQAAEFFLAERKAWVTFERARISYIRACRALGLPSPQISIERGWSKQEISNNEAQP